VEGSRVKATTFCPFFYGLAPPLGEGCDGLRQDPVNFFLLFFLVYILSVVWLFVFSALTLLFDSLEGC